MLVVHRARSAPPSCEGSVGISYQELREGNFAGLGGHSGVVLCPREWSQYAGVVEGSSEGGLSSGYLTALSEALRNRAATVFIPVPRPEEEDSGTEELPPGPCTGVLNFIERFFLRRVRARVFRTCVESSPDPDLPEIQALLDAAPPFFQVYAEQQYGEAVFPAGTEEDQPPAAVLPMTTQRGSDNCCAGVVPWGDGTFFAIVPAGADGPGAAELAAMRELAVRIPAWAVSRSGPSHNWQEASVTVEYDRNGEVYMNDRPTRICLARHPEQVKVIRQLIRWRKNRQSGKYHGYWPGYDPYEPAADGTTAEARSRFASRVADVRGALRMVGLDGLIESAGSDPVYEGRGGHPTGYRWAAAAERTTEI